MTSRESVDRVRAAQVRALAIDLRRRIRRRQVRAMWTLFWIGIAVTWLALLLWIVRP